MVVCDEEGAVDIATIPGREGRTGGCGRRACPRASGACLARRCRSRKVVLERHPQGVELPAQAVLSALARFHPPNYLHGQSRHTGYIRFGRRARRGHRCTVQCQATVTGRFDRRTASEPRRRDAESSDATIGKPWSHAGVDIMAVFESFA